MNLLSVPDIPSDIVKRITAAADQLYEDGGRNTFPTVDAVRRKASVNMNDASNVMRAWRRVQRAAAAPLPSSIPASVQEANNALLTATWNAATNAANSNLQTAQTGWEQERTEAEACRHQLATAFDNQTEELSTALQTIAALEQKLTIQREELLAAFSDFAKLQQEVAEVEKRAATAEIRSTEIAKRADDLKAELAQAHANADQARLDAKSRLCAADSTITQLREELRQTSAREYTTREDLAHLRGKVEAMSTEHHVSRDIASSSGNGRKGSALSTPPTATDHKSHN